jgi:hypothetical protein
VAARLLAGFHPEMALFRNLGVSLRELLVRRTVCTSPHNPARGGQALDFLDLAKNCSFLIWKLRECPFSFLDGNCYETGVCQGKKSR